MVKIALFALYLVLRFGTSKGCCKANVLSAVQNGAKATKIFRIASEQGRPATLGMGLVRCIIFGLRLNLQLTCDRYGKDDELGMLNRLTDEVVVQASKEIKTGKRYRPPSIVLPKRDVLTEAECR